MWAMCRPVCEMFSQAFELQFESKYICNVRSSVLGRVVSAYTAVKFEIQTNKNI